jgi:hypothetical protein
MSEEERDARFAAALNSHGYPFQNAILAGAQISINHNQSGWRLEAAELPVAVGPHTTKIDFILWTHETQWWIIGECKRVNPEYSDWFFVKSKRLRRAQSSDRFIVEQVDGAKVDPEFGKRFRARA